MCCNGRSIYMKNKRLKIRIFFRMLIKITKKFTFDEIDKAIKQTRQERNLTQEELGKLIGVQKAQISRLENETSNVTMDTLLRVFTALKAKVKLQVELPNVNVSVG